MAKRSRKVSTKSSKRPQRSKSSSRKTMKRTNKRKKGKYSSHKKTKKQKKVRNSSHKKTKKHNKTRKPLNKKQKNTKKIMKGGVNPARTIEELFNINKPDIHIHFNSLELSKELGFTLKENRSRKMIEEIEDDHNYKITFTVIDRGTLYRLENYKLIMDVIFKERKLQFTLVNNGYTSETFQFQVNSKYDNINLLLCIKQLQEFFKNILYKLVDLRENDLGKLIAENPKRQQIYDLLATDTTYTLLPELEMDKATGTKKLDEMKFSVLEKNNPDINSLPEEVGKPVSMGGTMEQGNNFKMFNRYSNILPNNHSRVVLHQDLEVTGVPKSKYINANFIKGFDNADKCYIAAQGPKDTTLNHFWHMVWQENVCSIVMVTGLREKERVKCARYWPETETDTVVYGNIEVVVNSGSNKDGYKVTELKVTNLNNNDFRTVKHFWFEKWPDYGVPDVDNATLVPKMLKDVNEWNDTQENPPLVVHCSAGIGRTGTFIGIDMGMKQLNANKTTNVLTLVESMRKDRGGMVQTEDQYVFIHRTLGDYIINTSAEAPLPQIPTQSLKFQRKPSVYEGFGASNL